MNIKVDVDDLKSEEQNMQTGNVGDRICQMSRGSAA